MEGSIAIDVEGSNESATEDPSVGGSGSRACALHFFFCIFALYTSYAPGPHSKANLCCTTLRVAGCELHMSTYQPTKTFLLHAEEGRVDL